MPTVTFSGGDGISGFDMRLWGAPNIIGIIQANFSSSHSSTQVTYTAGVNNYLIANGTFPTYDQFGDPTSGTVTSFVHVADGMTATVSGLSISVPTLFTWILNGNDQPLQAALFAGDDTITATSGADILTGYGGNDTINAGDGADEVRGDSSILYPVGVAGNDTINGGGGNDQLYGEDGADILDGGAGDDYIEGGAGNDFITGGDGRDILYGGAGTNTILGGAGDDVLYSDASGTFDGGDGLDTITVNLAATSLALTIDAVAAASGVGTTLANGTVLRNIEVLGLTTGSGNDTFVFNGPALLGPIDLGNLRGSFDGGGGDDLVIADLSSAAQALNLHASLGFVQGSGGIALYNIERMQVIAGAFGDVLTGASGDDVLSGGGGDDTIDGGAGNDQISGGDGNDRLVWSAGVDQIDGGAGIDSISFNLGASSVGITLSTANLLQPGGYVLPNGTVITNVERLGNVTFGSGNDTITAFDSIGDAEGGGGFDILIFDGSSLATPLNSANEEFRLRIGASYIYNFEQFQLIGGSAADAWSGMNGNDTLVGNGGNDLLRGGGGDDTLSGGAGDDDIQGGDGADVISGGDGDDRLAGGLGADTVDGGTGFDILVLDRQFLATAFNLTISTAALSSDTGLTIDGTLARNIERFEVLGGDLNDTLTVVGQVTGVNKFEGSNGVDRIVLDASGASFSVNVLNKASHCTLALATQVT